MNLFQIVKTTKCTATDAPYWLPCVQFRVDHATTVTCVCNVISFQRTLLEVMTRYNVQLSMYPDLIRFVKMKETAREALCGAVNASNEL